MKRLVMTISMLLFCAPAFCQVCFTNVSSFPAVHLRDELSRIKNDRVVWMQTYSDREFAAIADRLHRDYFAEAGNIFSKKDSTDIARDILKSSRFLCNVQKRDKRKLKLLAKREEFRLDTAVANRKAGSSVLEPCYYLEIDKTHPEAFVMKTAYKLTRTNSNDVLRVTF